jgi:hypothetical protein
MAEASEGFGIEKSVRGQLPVRTHLSRERKSPVLHRRASIDPYKMGDGLDLDHSFLRGLRHEHVVLDVIVRKRNPRGWSRGRRRRLCRYWRLYARSMTRGGHFPTEVRCNVWNHQRTGRDRFNGMNECVVDGQSVSGLFSRRYGSWFVFTLSFVIGRLEGWRIFVLPPGARRI